MLILQTHHTFTVFGQKIQISERHWFKKQKRSLGNVTISITKCFSETNKTIVKNDNSGRDKSLSSNKEYY